MKNQEAKADEGKLELVKEEWKTVSGYEGLYEVSSFGNVRTIRRRGTDERILKQQVDKKGYCLIQLCKNGKYKTCLVHRLVAKAFIENPEGFPCVNHKDENKTNNNAKNLEWCSYSYNNNYGTAKARASVTRYKPCVGKWSDGSEKIFDSCTIASKETGISQGNIWGACNGLWKTAGGVVWRYV